MLLYYWKN